MKPKKGGNIVLKKYRPYVPPVTGMKVKCLGPCEPPHWFWVTNATCGFGVCSRCHERQRVMSPMTARPVRMQADEC